MSLSMNPFRIYDVVNCLQGENKRINSISFFVEELDNNRFYTESDVNNLIHVCDFIGFYNNISSGFILELELNTDEFTIYVDDDEYIVIEFIEKEYLRIFLQKLLNHYGVYNELLFHKVINITSEEYTCIDKKGNISYYDDYYDMIENS